jgi:FixJ family two-component response regulator
MRTTNAVVDDDPSVLRGIGRLLEAHGYETRVFDSAEKFLSEHTARGARCLVLDIHLGGMSGIDLRRQLSALGADIPVIFVSATDDPAARADALDAGCVAFLQKPFTAHSLVDAIQKARSRSN